MKGGAGMDRYTRLYLKWITSEDLLYSTRNSAQRHSSLVQRGVWENGRMYIYGLESLHCPPETTAYF